MKYNVFATLVCLSITACSSYPAKLYPANDMAAEGGVLDVTITASWEHSRAPISFTMPDGEKMEGELTILQNKTVEFGAIYNSLDTNVDSGSALDVGTRVRSQARSPGIATLFGTNGTMVECEFYHVMGPHGAGVCKSSRGQLYKLHY